MYHRMVLVREKHSNMQQCCEWLCYVGFEVISYWLMSKELYDIWNGLNSRREETEKMGLKWNLMHTSQGMFSWYITDLQSSDKIVSLCQFGQRCASPPHLCDLQLQLSDHELCLVLRWAPVYLRHFQQLGLAALQRAHQRSEHLRAALHLALRQLLEKKSLIYTTLFSKNWGIFIVGWWKQAIATVWTHFDVS